MRVNLAATKTNLLRTKKNLAMTREGYELLDDKRKILINELIGMIHRVDRLEKDVDEALRKAYELTDRAIVIMGRRQLESLSLSINTQHSLFISKRVVMGVQLPVLQLKTQDHPPHFSPHEVSFYVDEVIVHFREVVTLLTQLAEKKIATLRLAKEAQKTIRKVNALEKVYIPYYTEAVKSLSDRLDEEARDAFTMLKLIKERLRS